MQIGKYLVDYWLLRNLDIDLENVLQHELLNVPLRLAKTDENKGTESKCMAEMEEEAVIFQQR